MPLTLERKIRKPTDEINKYTLMFVGEKKIGKTSFAMQFPKHHILEFEIGNASHLECSYDDVHNWEEAEDALKQLQANPEFCETIIIDDIPTAYELCLEYVREVKFKKGLMDKNNYDVWSVTKKVFMDWVKGFEKLNMGRIYTAHTKITTNETTANRTINRLEP
jgi:septin family protein